jgi:hypothetical protein
VADPGWWAALASVRRFLRVLDPLRGRSAVGADVVDRRFSRRHDAARTVEALWPPRLREQVDLHALSVELLAVVEQTMQPTQASLWLRPITAPHGQAGSCAHRQPDNARLATQHPTTRQGCHRISVCGQPNRM